MERIGQGRWNEGQTELPLYEDKVREPVMAVRDEDRTSFPEKCVDFLT